ncbi:hypothetical protein [Endozoicomonas sp. SESOKO1]|uniref:hypothetical protein n=1 Tax=Endozoicomonas sp. SESOKO1 TaxID=2828742 RepID=UPI002147D622|nr:hypothetical protein [Endozoicomonas sp. SESOKO1]
MKRYKQAILSNFFVTEDGSAVRHLVEANLDIESRGDRTLCTEVLNSDCRYEVLVNGHLSSVCMICSAILDRRISNMPVERKVCFGKKQTMEIYTPPENQLSLPGVMETAQVEEQNIITSIEEQPGQIELFI